MINENREIGAIADGWAALGRGDWESARAHFKAALEHKETPDALEGLGWAGWWLDDDATVFDVRERAYRLYRQRSDRRGAARVATWLVWDYIEFRGEQAVANGWLQRARRLLDGLAPAAEGGHDQARQHFEDVVDLFERSGARSRRRARIELANALAAAGRRAVARKEAQVAFEALTTLGAIREAERAAGVLRSLEAPHGGQVTKTAPRSRLTRRELDIVRLISQGLSDKEVAAHLSLSEHTVHRHVSNILTKLDLPSRAAAVAYAARQGLL